MQAKPTASERVRAARSLTDAPVHIGRSWHGTTLEDECPCGKAPCGLVDSEAISEECPQHAVAATKTMRQIHWAEECPRP